MVDAFIFSYADTQNYMNDKPTTEIGAVATTLKRNDQQHIDAPRLQHNAP